MSNSVLKKSLVRTLPRVALAGLFAAGASAAAIATSAAQAGQPVSGLFAAPATPALADSFGYHDDRRHHHRHYRRVRRGGVWINIPI